MATKLNKTIKRETESTVFERSQNRNIIVSVEPTRNGAVIGVKIKGYRDVYKIGVGSVYTIAVNNHLAKIERRAKQIMKAEGISMRSAKARAKAECNKELR